jgi:diphthamide biosynthesis methyltransferase
MLYLVGLGLSDETDITVRGLEIVKKASRVYLEAYTSILLVDQSVLVCVNTRVFIQTFLMANFVVYACL